MSKITKLLRTTIRGYGFIEVVRIVQGRTSTEYEIGLTFTSGNANNPASKIVDSLTEALVIHAEFAKTLIDMKTFTEEL